MTSFAKFSEKIIEFQSFWNFLFFREIIRVYDNAASIFAMIFPRESFCLSAVPYRVMSMT